MNLFNEIERVNKEIYGGSDRFNELKSMGLRELKAILKQFKSGYVGMGMRDIYLMNAVEDEIGRRTHETN